MSLAQTGVVSAAGGLGGGGDVGMIKGCNLSVTPVSEDERPRAGSETGRQSLTEKR